MNTYTASTLCITLFSLLIFYIVMKMYTHHCNTKKYVSPYKNDSNKKFKLHSASKAIPIKNITSDTIFEPSEF